jgi:hypothetical protein
MGYHFDQEVIGDVGVGAFSEGSKGVVPPQSYQTFYLY